MAFSGKRINFFLDKIPFFNVTIHIRIVQIATSLKTIVGVVVFIDLRGRILGMQRGRNI